MCALDKLDPNELKRGLPYPTIAEFNVRFTVADDTYGLPLEDLGVIFDKVPTYQEIKDGTQNASLIPDINQIFRLAFMPNVFMVGDEGLEPPTLCV